MGKIAPHRNCEVRLVLAGTKPLATIEKRKDPYGFSIACALIGTGMLFGYTHPTADSPEGEVVFTKPNARGASGELLIVQYKKLLSTGVKDYGIKQYHRLMGELFGYSKEDIEAFINAEIKCNCTKCAGG